MRQNPSNTVDFLFRKNRNKAAALAFFYKAIKHNGKPKTINTDKSGSRAFARKMRIEKDKIKFNL